MTRKYILRWSCPVTDFRSWSIELDPAMPIDVAPARGCPAAAADCSVFCTSSSARRLASEKGSVLKTRSSRVMWLRSRGGGRLGADVPRLGHHADGLACESIQESAVGPWKEACPAAG